MPRWYLMEELVFPVSTGINRLLYPKVITWGGVPREYGDKPGVSFSYTQGDGCSP